MKCHEARRRLDVFMDGELEVPENMKVLEHLNLCRACGEVFEGEKRLRASLKSSLGSQRAPAGLAARLSASLGGGAEAVAFDPGRMRRRGMVAAAALLFALAGSLLFAPSPGFQLMASELSERHAQGEPYACGEAGDERRCLCSRCTADVGPAIQAFFQRHALRDYCSHVAESAKLGYAFDGVAVWRCRGEDVFWSTWRTKAGARVSHALVSLTPPISGPRSSRRHGRPVLFYPRGDADRPELACVFVFGDAAEAERFTSALGLPVP